MQISFERTGGFAGMRMTFSTDLSELAEEDAATLRKLVQEADFFNLPESTGFHVHSDGFQYEIHIVMDGKEHSLKVMDGFIPEKLQPLLDDLSVRARTQRRRIP